MKTLGYLKYVVITTFHTRRWDQLRALGTSSLVQLTYIVPVAGYFILFSESLNDHLKLTFETQLSFWRVYFLYYGFCVLAMASLLFTVFCPGPVKHHGTAYEFVTREENILTKFRKREMERILLRRNYKLDGGELSDLDAVLEARAIAAAAPDPNKRNKVNNMIETIQGLGLPILMTEYFELLVDDSRGIRRIVTWSYILGFLLLMIPTASVFYYVSVSAIERIATRF